MINGLKLTGFVKTAKTYGIVALLNYICILLVATVMWCLGLPIRVRVCKKFNGNPYW